MGMTCVSFSSFRHTTFASAAIFWSFSKTTIIAAVSFAACDPQNRSNCGCQTSGTFSVGFHGFKKQQQPSALQSNSCARAGVRSRGLGCGNQAHEPPAISSAVSGK